MTVDAAVGPSRPVVAVAAGNDARNADQWLATHDLNRFASLQSRQEFSLAAFWPRLADFDLALEDDDFRWPRGCHLDPETCAQVHKLRVIGLDDKSLVRRTDVGSDQSGTNVQMLRVLEFHLRRPMHGHQRAGIETTADEPLLQA